MGQDNEIFVSLLNQSDTIYEQLLISVDPKELFIHKIRQDITNGDWKTELFGGKKPDGFDKKLPNNMAKIYELCNDASKNTPEKFEAILGLLKNANKPQTGNSLTGKTPV